MSKAGKRDGGVVAAVTSAIRNVLGMEEAVVIRGPKGFIAGGVAAGIKKSGAADLAMIVSDRPAVTAAVTTKNIFCGAPVTVTRERLKASATTRGIIVNAGCSNVATGEQGLADARAVEGRQ